MGDVILSWCVSLEEKSAMTPCYAGHVSRTGPHALDATLAHFYEGVAAHHLATWVWGVGDSITSL